MTPEQHFLEFDPAGQRERLEIQLHKVSDPTGPFAQKLADYKYRGYSLIQRAAQLEIINELVISTLRNLNFKLALADPQKLFRIVQKFITSAQRVGDSAEADLCTSSLWDALITGGCDPDVIRPEAKEAQDEKFNRVSELATLVFAHHGLRRAENSTSGPQ